MPLLSLSEAVTDLWEKAYKVDQSREDFPPTYSDHLIVRIDNIYEAGLIFYESNLYWQYRAGGLVPAILSPKDLMASWKIVTSKEFDAGAPVQTIATVAFCAICDGSGYVEDLHDPDTFVVTVPCHTCRGTGVVQTIAQP